MKSLLGFLVSAHAKPGPACRQVKVNSNKLLLGNILKLNVSVRKDGADQALSG
jgi:hypothetical protein